MKGDKGKKIKINKGKDYPTRLQSQPRNIAGHSKKLKTGLNLTDEKHGGSDLRVPELKQSASTTHEDNSPEYSKAELEALEKIRVQNKAATEAELESTKTERMERMVAAEKNVSAHFDARSTKDREKFTKLRDKNEGMSTGRFTHLSDDLSKQYLEKETVLNYASPGAVNKDHRDFAMEYIYGPMVRIALSGRSPQIELVAQEGSMDDKALGTPKSKIARATSTDKIYLTSKLLGDGYFQTLAQYSGSHAKAGHLTSHMPHLVGMEAALLICAFIGDGDIHGANFGVNAKTNEVYKIDLGKAGWVFFSKPQQYLETLVKKMARPEYNYIDSHGGLKVPFNITKAKEAVNNILNVLTEELITNTLERRIHNLNKAGFLFHVSDLSAYIMDGSEYTAPKSGSHDIRTFKTTQINNLLSSRKMFEKFENYLSIVEQIDFTSVESILARKAELEQLSKNGELLLLNDEKERWEQLKDQTRSWGTAVLDDDELREYNKLKEQIIINGLPNELGDEYISLVENIVQEEKNDEIWRNGYWLSQMNGMDPIEWALENDRTIGGKTPLQFLLDLKNDVTNGKASGDLRYINEAIAGIIINFTERNIPINGQNALQYAIENGITYEENKDMADFYFVQNNTIFGLNPLSWAMDKNLTIHGKDILSFVKARREEVAASGVGFTTAIDQCISEAMNPAPVVEAPQPLVSEIILAMAATLLKQNFDNLIELNNKRDYISKQDYNEEFKKIKDEYIMCLTQGPEITKEVYAEMMQMLKTDPNMPYFADAITTLNMMVGMSKFDTHADKERAKAQIAALEQAAAQGMKL